MPRKPAPEPVKRVIVRPEIKKCPERQTTLMKRRHKDRIVWTFEGPVLERTIFLHCPNPDCKMHGVEVRPTRSLAPPRLTYSKEVIAEIIIMREKERKALREIQAELAKRGIQISHEAIRKIYKQYLILAADKIAENIVREIRKLGCAVIAIDGVQPEKGKASLWIVTELQVGQPIHAEILESQSIERIADMLEKVKRKLGVPVIAIVSNGQQSVIKAAKRVLPEAKHQFCQFHYLRNVSAKACDADGNLAKKIRAKVRALHYYRKARSRYFKATPLLIRIGQILHAILAMKARYPLKFRWY